MYPDIILTTVPITNPIATWKLMYDSQKKYSTLEKIEMFKPSQKIHKN